MRQSRVKSLRQEVYRECERRGISDLGGKRQVFRRFKRTYARTPWTEREHYSIYESRSSTRKPE